MSNILFALTLGLMTMNYQGDYLTLVIDLELKIYGLKRSRKSKIFFKFMSFMLFYLDLSLVTLTLQKFIFELLV